MEFTRIIVWEGNHSHGDIKDYLPFTPVEGLVFPLTVEGRSINFQVKENHADPVDHPGLLEVFVARLPYQGLLNAPLPRIDHNDRNTKVEKPTMKRV